MADVLNFKKASTEKEIREVFDYNIDAFSDSPDFEWALEAIENEIEKGWELYGVYLEKEIIAAAFLRVKGKTLYSKNTSIKMNYQGSGFSHQVKDFFEQFARSRKLVEIFHYCRIDNFRMYSLNESHGFSKTESKLGDDQLTVEWLKKLK